MPDEIYGVMAVKNGQKQTIMNLSNARQKSYADLQTMTDAQKKGVIVCPDYPKEEYLVAADEVSYGGGTVKDALDRLPIEIKIVQGTTPSVADTYGLLANFPTGWDANNTYVVGFVFRNPNNLWYSNIPEVSVITTELEGIRSKVTNASYVSRPIKVMLARIV